MVDVLKWFGLQVSKCISFLFTIKLEENISLGDVIIFSIFLGLIILVIFNVITPKDGD